LKISKKLPGECPQIAIVSIQNIEFSGKKTHLSFTDVSLISSFFFCGIEK
jgi:hypothetical protein